MIREITKMIIDGSIVKRYRKMFNALRQGKCDLLSIINISCTVQKQTVEARRASEVR